MTEINRSQFYSGGFFLIRSGHPDWEELNDGLLPDTLVSLSYCINQRFNLVWTWIPNDKNSAIEFGIREDKWEEVKNWCSENFEEKVDLGGMFHSVEVAQDFIADFVVDLDDLWLIEIGLPQFLKSLQWEEPTSDDFPIQGIEKRIEQEISLSTDGDILGFDIVNYEYQNLSHSWLCSYFHRDMFDMFGIQTNQYGLIHNYDETMKIYDWISDEEMIGNRGEPQPYDFWLLVSHPLK